MSDKQFIVLMKKLRAEHEEAQKKDKLEYELRVKALRERFN